MLKDSTWDEKRGETQNKLKKKVGSPTALPFFCSFPEQSPSGLAEIHSSLISLFISSDGLSQAQQFAFYIKRGLR